MNSTVEAITFSESLIRYCVEESGLRWNKKLTFPVDNEMKRIVKAVGTATLDLICQGFDMVAECKSELEDSRCTSSEEFTRCALAAARFYFPKGYTHEAFLSYCAMVVGVACQFYTEGSIHIAFCAAEVVGLVVIAHILTKKFYDQGGYDKLCEVSTLYSSSVRGRKGKSKRGSEKGD